MGIENDYKITELGQIPIDWGIYPLKEVVSIIGDGNYSSKYPKSDDFIDFGIPFLRANNLINGKLSMKDVRYISPIQHESLKKGHIKIGDIIITVRGEIGKVAITTNEFDDVNINAQLAFLRFKDHILSRFILYFFQSDVIQNLFFSITTGTALQQLPINRLKNISIISPPLKEQQKIAKILSIVDEQIEQTDQLIERTKELKNGFMQQLLTKGIGHTSFKKTDLGEIPDEWEIRKVNDIATVTTGNKDTKDKDDDGIYPFFVRSQKVESINSYSYDGESILTAGDGVGVGKVFHYINGKFDFHQRVYKISDFMNIEGKYLYYYFSHNFYNRAMKYNAKTSVDSVRRDMITQMEIPVPSASEQKKIISILFCIDEDIEGYQQEKAKYEKLKKGLMQQLLTGKTRVKVD